VQADDRLPQAIPAELSGNTLGQSPAALSGGGTFAFTSQKAWSFRTSLATTKGAKMAANMTSRNVPSAPPLRRLARRALASPFLRHNAVYFAGSLLVAFLNYLYYPVLGRLLQPADFGEVQAVISLFLQAGVFLQVLGTVTVGVFKKYPDPG